MHNTIAEAKSVKSPCKLRFYNPGPRDDEGQNR